MINVSEILNLFLTPELIETLGNWYPRVIAVMSCVIPTMYIGFAMLVVWYIFRIIWGWLNRA